MRHSSNIATVDGLAHLLCIESGAGLERLKQ